VLQQSIKEAQGKASSKNPAKPRKKAA